MKKSPLRIIKIFVYIVILFLVAMYALFGDKTKQIIEIKAPIRIEEVKPVDTEKPTYQLPPKGEFYSN